MIDDYQSEEWTDLLEGILSKMAEKISNNRQWYKTVDGDDVVKKVKQVLKDCFHSAAAMQVVELEVGQKYMITETYGSMLNINLNQQQTQHMAQMEHQQRHIPTPPAPARVKTNILTIQEKTCSCGRWHEYEYPCRHAIAYFRKWEHMSFLDILQQHVHEYYRNKRMQQIYEYYIFQLYKIRSDIMEKPIHQHWGQRQPG